LGIPCCITTSEYQSSHTARLTIRHRNTAHSNTTACIPECVARWCLGLQWLFCRCGSCWPEAHRTARAVLPNLRRRPVGQHTQRASACTRWPIRVLVQLQLDSLQTKTSPMVRARSKLCTPPTHERSYSHSGLGWLHTPKCETLSNRWCWCCSNPSIEGGSRDVPFYKRWLPIKIAFIMP
jgi:hypothetical protein